jgi:hypothetical protein
MAMLIAASGSSLAQLSEIDSYEQAVNSQSKEDALAFIEEYSSSHLIGDLIESLRPEVAHKVCANLSDGVSNARRACEQLPPLPVAEATAVPKDATASTSQESAAAAPTQPIETQPTGETATVPATIGTVAVAPKVAIPAIGGQSETSAPTTAVALGETRATTPVTEIEPSPPDPPQVATIAPPTPIKSKPVVYVRFDSDAEILARAEDGSPVIGTVSRSTPLTVLGRDRNWLKVLVPGMTDRSGWVQTSSLQTDIGGIKVGTATGNAAPSLVPATSPPAAPTAQVGTSAVPEAQSETSAATSAAATAPLSFVIYQPPAATPPPVVKSKPVVYVTSDSGANIFAQAVGGLQIIGTAPRNAPLTVLGRDGNWLKVLVPGTTDRAGWVHIRKLQTDTGGIKVGTTAENTAPSLKPGISASTVSTSTTPAAPSLMNAAFPPTPIKSKPVVFVRSDSDANILVQAMDGSPIIVTASRDTPLTVLGRDRNWLKVLVPGVTDRAGWVRTSSLQTDAGGIIVVPENAADP